MTKASWGKKDLFGLSFHITEGTQLGQKRNLQAGVDAEAMKGCCVLACSSWLVQLSFL